MDDKKHVLLMCFIADPFDPIGINRIGGGHIYLLDLARFLVQQGYNVSFITRKNHENKLNQEQLGECFTIYRIECGPNTELSPDVVGANLTLLMEKTIHLIDTLPTVHIIHSHYWISGIVATEYCKLNKIRHIHTVLSIGKVKESLGELVSDIDDFRNECEENIYNSADALLLICPNEKINFIHYFPDVDKNKLYIIPNGINTKIFYPREVTPDNYFYRSTDRFKERVSSIS